MTMPVNQCPWRVQVHHITQEMPDVWTASLVCHDYYPYHTGQYTLISMRNSAETLRTYTISSASNMSEHITLTVRQIDDGVSSQWLTRSVKHGGCLWLSDAMGEPTHDGEVEDKFLLLVAGYGVTPIMSTHRWLAKNRPQADVQVVYNVCTLQDAILAGKWCSYPVTLVAEDNVTEGSVAGCLTREPLVGIPDLVSRTMMACGPTPYTNRVERRVKVLNATHFFKEKLFTPVTEVVTNGLKFTRLQPAREFYTPAGIMPLGTLESDNVPVTAICRAGVCGCCKTKVVSDEYTVSSTMMLTDAEVAEGYVLACSCRPQGDLALT